MKSDTTSSSARNHSQDLSDVLQAEFRSKRETVKSSYEVKNQKDRTLMQYKDVEFLMLKTDGMPEEQAALINDDEVLDVGEIEDISPYDPCEFVGEDDVDIPYRTINDSFLNKLCTRTFISDQTNKPECIEPTDKELLIDSDDEGVDTRYKVFDDVLYPEFDPSLPWNEMKPTLGLRFEHPEQLKECLINYGLASRYQLWYRRNDYKKLMVLCGRDIAEGRCGGKKGKKGDLPAKKGKAEGVQIESPSKGNKGKKGVQSPGKKGKGVQSPGKKGKCIKNQGA
nr:S-adenosyl-L-methionine-dependent methyltransferase [Tanacetum cinerariifolium]